MSKKDGCMPSPNSERKKEIEGSSMMHEYTFLSQKQSHSVATGMIFSSQPPKQQTFTFGTQICTVTSAMRSGVVRS